MYKLLFLWILTVGLLNAQALNWSHDYEKTLQQAQREHKNIYLFIGADKCRFCDTFKKTALTNKALLKRLHANYLTVYLSRDRHVIPEQFEKVGVPKHYFIRENGKIFYKDWGGREAAGFMLMLDEAELSY